MRWLLLICLALAAASACTLFDEDPPGEECVTDMDCFRAQGEFCNQQTKQCQQRVLDAAVPTPDAAPIPDAAISDAEVDAP